MSLLSRFDVTNREDNPSTVTVTSLLREHGTFNPQLTQEYSAERAWGQPATQICQMEADCMNGAETLLRWHIYLFTPDLRFQKCDCFFSLAAQPVSISLHSGFLSKRSKNLIGLKLRNLELRK